MIKKTTILVGMLLSTFVAGYAQEDARTVALHAEIKAHNNDNVTSETYPTLYAMIKELCEKAGVTMPRYITLYDAQYDYMAIHGNRNNGYATGHHYKGQNYIGAYTNLWGDWYICRQLVASLPYDTVQGVVAQAAAEKITWRTPKRACVASIIAASVLKLFYDSYNTASYKQLTAKMVNGAETQITYDSINQVDKTAMNLLYVEIGLFSSLICGAIADYFAAAYTQKNVDKTAATVAGTLNVVNAIQGADTVKETYFKESLVKRFLEATHLQPLIDFITYPVRQYSSAERIAYLQ